MIEFFAELMNQFASALAEVLPVSPFQPYLTAFRGLPYLGYLNWFIPVRSCIKIGMSWLGVIAMFYLYSIIMRWLKVIGD